MYNCLRSSTVWSENYSTLARITRQQFIDITRKSQVLEEEMTDRINFYTDSNRSYTLECLERIPFFSNLSQEDKNALVFNFELKTYKKGSMIQSPGNIPNSVMIIVKGIAEVYTNFGESEFKIEYLRQGDIINHTLFLYKKPASLPIRCVINCEALILTFDKVTMIKDSKPESSLNRELEKILANAHRVGFDKLFLDYIKKPRPTSEIGDEATLAKRNENHRKIKNIGIYYLADYRVKNKKPSINEILQDVILKDKENRKA